MLKEKMKRVSSFLLKNSKLVLPIIIILAVAVTVSFALQAKDDKVQEQATIESSIQETEKSVEPTAEPVHTEIPLAENTVPELHTLICTYYTAYANGDIDTIKSISNYLEETEALRITAMSEYVEEYPQVTIYTRKGPQDNSYLAYVYFKMKVTNYEEAISGMETFYVCTREDGTLYLNEGEVSEEELEYIRNVASQEDVVDLYNRVNVECSDTFKENEELFYYIQEIVNEVQKSTGEALAEQNATVKNESEEVEEPEENQVVQGETQQPESVENAGPIYAKASTTVNVRASDSEQADKVDKVTRGTKVEVLEQKVNGWSKVKIENTEGYIKSEFLQLLNVASNSDVIGTVTASSNVNVRSAASETAERIGVLAGGEEVDLLGRENGWCKINYSGQIGFVKEDFVR